MSLNSSILRQLNCFTSNNTVFILLRWTKNDGRTALLPNSYRNIFEQLDSKHFESVRIFRNTFLKLHQYYLCVIIKCAGNTEEFSCCFWGTKKNVLRETIRVKEIEKNNKTKKKKLSHRKIKKKREKGPLKKKEFQFKSENKKQKTGRLPQNNLFSQKINGKLKSICWKWTRS